MNTTLQLLLLTAAFLLLLPSTVHSSCRHPVRRHRQGLLTLHKKGCKSQTVQLAVCAGGCSSVTFPEYILGKLEAKMRCHSCEPKKMVERSIKLQCGSTEEIVTYKEASRCECKYLGECRVGSRKRRSLIKME